MGSPNGGIIGVVNPTSFGKCTQTIATASTTLTTQPGTRLVSYAVVAGGGSGGKGNNPEGGGGGVSVGSGGGSGMLVRIDGSTCVSQFNSSEKCSAQRCKTSLSSFKIDPSLLAIPPTSAPPTFTPSDFTDLKK